MYVSNNAIQSQELEARFPMCRKTLAVNKSQKQKCSNDVKIGGPFFLLLLFSLYLSLAFLVTLLRPQARSTLHIVSRTDAFPNRIPPLLRLPLPHPLLNTTNPNILHLHPESRYSSPLLPAPSRVPISSTFIVRPRPGSGMRRLKARTAGPFLNTRRPGAEARREGLQRRRLDENFRLGRHSFWWGENVRTTLVSTAPLDPH
jgi:hypothetical protein